MAAISMLFGVLLIALGAVAYFATGAASVTAWIPAFFGVPLLGLGVIARKERARKHAMHAAAALGLIGLIGAGVQAVPKLGALFSGSAERPAAVTAQLVMAVLCGVYVGFSVRSFVRARQARRSGAGSNAADQR